MHPSLVTVTAAHPLREAADRMARASVGRVPVVDAEGLPLGRSLPHGHA